MRLAHWRLLSASATTSPRVMAASAESATAMTMARASGDCAAASRCKTLMKARAMAIRVRIGVVLRSGHVNCMLRSGSRYIHATLGGV